MIIYPAIDIKDGRCVRLLQGKEDQVTIYDDDPVAVALKWQKEGAEFVHVVDLDGAFGGRPRNTATVTKIVQSLDIPVQFGGGVRSIEAIKELIESGVGQVILGTIAITEPVIFARAMEMFDDRIVVGLDGSQGNIAVEGWTKETDEDIISTGRRLADMGVHRVIYTDVSRDGTQMGPNVEATQALARAIGIPVTASGGVASLADISALRQLAPDGVEGVIVGKALYEHNFTLREAIETAG